jgi:acetolactate synthase-1/2/3 large subunit
MGMGTASDAFLKRGVGVSFYGSGESISPVQRACEWARSIKIISAPRHEQAATFMAEAYGRMTRKPGIVVDSMPPVFTNTLSGFRMPICRTRPSS